MYYSLPKPQGSTGQMQVWIFKPISLSCCGKKIHHLLELVILTIIQVLRSCQRKAAALWVVFTLLLTIYSAYISAQVSLSSLLQVNEVNWLLLTFSWRPWSWDRDQSSVSAVIKVFTHVDRGGWKHQGTFRLMMASLRPILCHSEWWLKRQRDDIFTGPLINTFVCICKVMCTK